MGLRDLFSRKQKKSKFNEKDDCIGIVFDIEELGNGTYGKVAYEILFKNLNPYQMGYYFTLWDGDTDSTLKGQDYDYCIRIDSSQDGVIKYVKEIFEKATDKGLADIEKRFIYSGDLQREPLVYGAYVIDGIVHTPGGPPAWGIKKYDYKWQLYMEKDHHEFITGKNRYDGLMD